MIGLHVFTDLTALLFLYSTCFEKARAEASEPLCSPLVSSDQPKSQQRAATLKCGNKSGNQLSEISGIFLRRHS